MKTTIFAILILAVVGCRQSPPIPESIPINQSTRIDCSKCGIEIDFMNGHKMMYSDERGILVLCEKCWSGMTPRQRLPYYRGVFDDWQKYPEVKADAPPELWITISNAVISGH